MKTKIVVLACLGSLFPAVAQAYMGPGAGLSAIGSSLALILGFLAAILGFVWYPVKRLIKGKKGAVLEAAEAESSPGGPDSANAEASDSDGSPK